MAKNKVLLAEMIQVAETVHKICGVPREEITLVLPFGVLPKTIAIQGYNVEHGDDGPNIFW